MNKYQIWEVLESCLLAADDVSLEYLNERGFNPKLSKLGIDLFNHLKKMELEVIET